MKERERANPWATASGWVQGILMPSVVSGAAGGALVGGGLGLLLAPPHHYLETVLGSTLIGGGVGFIIAWIGAAVIGLIRYFVLR